MRKSRSKVCNEAGIKSRVQRKRAHLKTTDSNHPNKVNANVLNRKFTASKPNEKWVTDITYIETEEGFVYLSGILDMYSRRIIGRNIERHMKVELVTETLRRAIENRGEIPKHLLLHSDRGVQYTSEEFRASLALLGIEQSMSGKGNCWDNAPSESFWGKLKSEWVRQERRYKNLEEARLSIFEYIEGCYYNKRLHQSLGYRTPRQVEEEYFSKKREFVEEPH